MNLAEYRLNNTGELDVYLRRHGEKFFQFYRQVESMLFRLPPGEKIYIPDVCKADTYKLFVKIACYCILTEMDYLRPYESFLEISGDYCWINRRSVPGKLIDISRLPSRITSA